MNKVGKFMKALAHLNFEPRALPGAASIGGKRDERFAGSIRTATLLAWCRSSLPAGARDSARSPSAKL